MDFIIIKNTLSLNPLGTQRWTKTAEGKAFIEWLLWTPPGYEDGACGLPVLRKLKIYITEYRSSSEHLASLNISYIETLRKPLSKAVESVV